MVFSPALDPTISEYTVTTGFAFPAKVTAEAFASNVEDQGTGTFELTGKSTKLEVTSKGNDGTIAVYLVNVVLPDLPEGDDLRLCLEGIEFLSTSVQLAPFLSPSIVEYQAAKENGSNVLLTATQLDSRNSISIIEGSSIVSACTETVAMTPGSGDHDIKTYLERLLHIGVQGANRSRSR